ncbi:MAG: DUF4268 domain-containing protein [Polyangiaceae bacterium]
MSIAEEKVTFHRPTERAQAYLAFYSELVEELEKASPGLVGASRPSGLNWLNVKYLSHAGQRVGVLAFTFAHRARFRVELYIDCGDGDRNKVVFDRLLAHKHRFETALGEVAWERLDNRRASRIAVYRAGSIEDPPKKLAALRAWGVEYMGRFNALIGPLLEKVLGRAEAPEKVG